MTESNTNAIDAKKKETKGDPGDFSSNILKFLTSVLSLIVLVIIYFSLSGLVLYGCKLGQANILPTNIHCYPYTNEKPSFPNNDNGIPINIFTTFTDPPLSMKINFPYNKYNSSNTVLDLLRGYKEEPKSHFILNYFISILDSLFCFNYSSFNFILNSLNKLPEVLLILFGPILFAVAALFLFLFDHLYLIYLWFANMTWFFKKNTNNSSDPNSKPSWKHVGLIDSFDYASALFFVFVFIMLLGVLLLGLPVLPFITICLAIFSGLNYSGVMNGKSAYCLTVIRDLFKTYKITIMVIFSIFVITSAFANLGTISGVFSILTLAMIYWGIITIEMFKGNKDMGLSAVSSYEQAKKVCNFKDTSVKHGTLYNWIIGQEGGGGHIKQTLKKLGKELKGL
jgi:hypothetical protein